MTRTTDERRHFSRVPFHRPAELDLRPGSATCELLDISLRGALLELPLTFAAAPGQRCTVTVRLDAAGEAVIRMEGEIAHREHQVVGVRCVEIDLESISHLRRLLELNVGDDALMRRELAALVHAR